MKTFGVSDEIYSEFYGDVYDEDGGSIIHHDGDSVSDDHSSIICPVSNEEAGSVKSLQVSVTGPSLLCAGLATLLSGLDGINAVVLRSEQSHQRRSPNNIAKIAKVSEPSQADVWLLLSWSDDHLKRTLSEEWFQTLVKDGVQHRAVLVLSAPMITSLVPSAITPAAQVERDNIEALLRTAGAAGIHAFVDIEDPPEALASVIVAASVGEPFCSASLTPWLFRALQTLRPSSSTYSPSAPMSPCSVQFVAHAWGLTRREGEIASQAAQGLPNEDIARSLFLSVNTIKTHLKEIFRKGGVTCRSQLAARWAVEASKPSPTTPQSTSPLTIVFSNGNPERIMHRPLKPRNPKAGKRSKYPEGGTISSPDQDIHPNG